MFKAKGLSKRYGKGPNSVLALREANFSLPEKGVVGIKGKSGSGKSTLLMILATLCRQSSGILRFGKRNMECLRGKALSRFRREEIGIVYQHYNLLDDLSLEENVAYPLMLSGVKRKEAISRARELLGRLLGEHLFSKKPGECSGGEKQRAAIARALIGDPKVILADEPTGALDEANGRAVMELLRSAGETRLIVIISHSPELDSYCDHVMEMDGGKLSHPVIEKIGEIRFKKKKARADGRLFLDCFKTGLKEDRNHLLSAFACCLIGFASLLLGLGFFAGSQASILNARIKAADAGMAYATISKTVSVDEKQITLIKNERPSLDVVDDLLSGYGEFVVSPDYSFIFPEACEADFYGRKIECSFAPIYDFSYLDEYGLSYEGSLPSDGSFSHCVVNEAFLKANGGSFPLAPILLELGSALSGEGWEYDFRLSLSLIPMAVVEEFSFMNSPRVYYSYRAFQNELSNMFVEPLSQLVGRPISIRDICEEADCDSPFSNYRYAVFAKDKPSLQPLFEVSEQLSAEKSPLQLISRAYSSYEAFQSLSSSLEACMFFFGGIEFVLCACIAVLSSFISFRKHLRRSAIMISLGASSNLTVTAFASPSILMVLLGCIASIPASGIISYLLNITFYKIFRLEYLMGRPGLNYSSWLSYIFVIGFALLVGLFVYVFSLVLIKKLPLDSEMKDE